jgi:hypothetical protein
VLVEALRQRFGPALDAVLLYGSCLRASEVGEGIADFYVIVDRYDHAYGQRHLAYLNAMLPPNVFYLEACHQGRTLRAKYAVVSRTHFEQGTRDWFHPYLWARFAQPTRLLYARDDTIRARAHVSLAEAVIVFLESILPMLEVPVVNVETLWTHGLGLTYAAELRPERTTRAQQLARLNLEDYARLTARAVPGLAGKLEELPDGRYRHPADASARRRSARRWRLRRWQGKILTVLRLAKAAFTFGDSIGYAAWKIERHTGVHVEVTPLLRRHPLLWGLKVSWRLLRRGIMR